MPIQRRNVLFNPDDGSASLSVFNVDVPDALNLVSSLTGGDTFPAKVSFVCHWSGGAEQEEMSNADLGYSGNFFKNKAVLSWSAQNDDGFSFVADPATEGFALSGTTSNGQMMS